MRLYHHAPPLVVVLALLVLATPRPAKADLLAEAAAEKASQETLAVELGFDHTSGKYGNSVTTTAISFPLSILYFPTPRLDMGVLVPYLRQNNGLVVGGRVVRGATVSPQQRARTARDNKLSGIGDLVLSAGYAPLLESDRAPQLRLTANVKAPTAGTSLGTGEFDETLGLGLSKNLGKWYLFADGGYTFQGKTTLFTARNFAEYDFGLGYEVLSGLRPSLDLKGNSSAEAGVGASSQVEGKLIYAVSRAFDVKLNLARGLSVNSPEWEVGLAFGYNF